MWRKTHWNAVFTEKDPDAVSWYQPHLSQSLELIRRANIGKLAAVIDIGGGTSTLVDDLLDDGFQNITVLDVSAAALQVTQNRLGPRAGAITWLEADILDAELPSNHFDLWHDRAVFHFLTDEQERLRYVHVAKNAIRSEGSLIIATFAADGPQQCSGLTTARYSPDLLGTLFSDGFAFIESLTETHQTPWNSEQKFIYCRLKRTIPPS